MKETYGQMKSRHQAETNAIPMAFAFGQKQFDEMMQKWGLDSEKDLDKIYAIGGGGFIQKKDSKIMHDTFERHEKERTGMKSDFAYLYDGFLYQIGNHEYLINPSGFSEVLESMDITNVEYCQNKTMQTAFKKALAKHRQLAEENGWY